MRLLALSLLCAVACSEDSDRDRIDISQDPSTAEGDGGDPRQVPARSPDSGPGRAIGGSNSVDPSRNMDASTQLDAEVESTPNTPKSDASTAAQFACQTSNDCAILNVGSCCGFFPRCANSGAVFTQPECNGVGGTCGFPAIDGCACQAGQCVSLQGNVVVNYP